MITWARERQIVVIWLILGFHPSCLGIRTNYSPENNWLWFSHLRWASARVWILPLAINTYLSTIQIKLWKWSIKKIFFYLNYFLLRKYWLSVRLFLNMRGKNTLCYQVQLTLKHDINNFLLKLIEDKVVLSYYDTEWLYSQQ
jgi:hypothetical protein